MVGLESRFSPELADRFGGGPAAGGIGQWRRVRSEISTCACPHGPIAAATSDRTAIRPVIEQRSASRAPRAHHFCHRLRLRPETMVRPPTGRGPWPLACRIQGIGPLTNRLPRVRRAHASPVSPQHWFCQPPPRIGAAALKQPMTRKFASWSWPWWVKSQAMSGAALAHRCSRHSSRTACCCASTTCSFAAERLSRSHSYRARGAWPNSNPTLTLNLNLTLSLTLPSRQLKADGVVRLRRVHDAAGSQP